MFPRVSSEPATDDDRQSTSEPADISVDLSSSDTFDQRTGRHNRMNNPPSDQSYLSTATTRDLDASNKRKRRKQLEAFLNDNSEYYKFDNPESRLRFQEAPFQPILMCPTDGPTNNRTSTSTSSTKHAIESSSSDLCSSGRGITVGPSHSMMCSSTATMSSPWASPPSSSLSHQRNAHSRQSQLRQVLGSASRQPQSTDQKEAEDRKGASSGTPSTNPNTYDKGHLLRTDIVKMHKFSFERVPSSEPWYEAFQRQDECRERVFEYWGSTCKSFHWN